MEQDPLKRSDARVLRGLVRYPLLSDKDLASKLDMKSPTVTAIRRKLVENRVLRSVEVPDFAALGCEVMVISLGSLVSYPALEERLASVSDLFQKEEIVYAFMEPGQDFMIQISPSLTCAMRNIHSIEERYQSQGFIEEPMQVLAFPLGTSEVYRYFDFTPLLDVLFEGKEREEVRKTHFRTRSVKLGRKESIVLSSLVERPEANDTEHSKRLDISRMTVGRARRRFREERIVERILIPDFSRTGIRLLVVTSARFHPRSSATLKYNLPRIMKLLGPAFFCVHDPRKIVAVSAFRDFGDYKRRFHELSEAYKEHEYFWDAPKRLLFSLDQSIVGKDHDYGPLVGKLLALGTEKG
ncbi:MAG: MarR family transcriptional regulator [Thermoplasmata archaeon]|nr:MarR family transcriptional regulator [Thermoplasmata archaeon]